MAKLEYLIVCDDASFSGSDQKLNIVGVFDNINTLGFPAVHPKMSVVVLIFIEAGTYTETLRVKKGDLEVLSIDTSLVKDVSGNHRFIHNLFNVRFPEQGEYVFEVLIDREPIGSTIVNVRQV